MANNETPLEEPPYIRYFSLILIFLGCLGGFLALTVPLWKSLSNIPVVGPVLGFLSLLIPASDTDNKYPESKAIADLRLHILYITGGIIAILTLLQTSWKNQVDRRKVEADIQKNEQDAKNEAAKREQDAVKSERDHTRQVHAERRSRYTTAVEQLASEKAAVRLGGIYTLTGLVDEWLADDSLKPKKRRKEGQVIINSLCSYIRSPFPLAEKREVLEKDQAPDDYDGNFTAERAQLLEEQDVRRTIFIEMSKCGSTPVKEKKGKVTITSSVRSTFGFDFSRAPIFYPLNNLSIVKGNFASTRFYGGADFQDTEFTGDANFEGAEFIGDANFLDAKFTRGANFEGVKFIGDANFLDAKFTRGANFGGVKFNGNADFLGVKFTEEADFGCAKFTGDADFSEAEFTKDADFGGAKFTRGADFMNAEFARNAHFLGADFSGNTSFDGAYFEKYAPSFADGSLSARFSAQKDQQDYVFSVSRGSKPIKCGTATLGGKSFEIPLGAVLFDPDSWDEEEQDYTRLSEPAQ